MTRSDNNQQDSRFSLRSNPKGELQDVASAYIPVGSPKTRKRVQPEITDFCRYAKHEAVFQKRFASPLFSTTMEHLFSLLEFQ